MSDDRAMLGRRPIPKDAARAIATGRKTTIRFIAQRGQAGARWAPCGYKLGQTYPVRMHGHATPSTHIRIVGLEHGRAGDAGLQSARSEGHRTTRDYRIAFVREHDHGWTERHPEAAEPELEDRFAKRWANVFVWVLRFKVTSDVPVFMAIQRGRAEGDGQYVRDAGRSIDSDAECVDHATLERYAAVARPFGEALRAARLEQQLEVRRKRNAERGRLRAQRSTG